MGRIALCLLLLPLSMLAKPDTVHQNMSLKVDHVNLRVGPGPNYAIQWEIKKKNLPVEVLAHFQGWYKIKIYDGTMGWVRENMVVKTNYAIVTRDVNLNKDPSPTSPPKAKLKAPLIVRMNGCEKNWCQVKVSDERLKKNYKGYVPADTLG